MQRWKIIVSQYKRGSLPHVFDDYFNRNDHVHTQDREQDKAISYICLDLYTGQKNMKVLGVKVLNNLPENIITCQTLTKNSERN